MWSVTQVRPSQTAVVTVFPLMCLKNWTCSMLGSFMFYILCQSLCNFQALCETCQSKVNPGPELNGSLTLTDHFSPRCNFSDWLSERTSTEWLPPEMRGNASPYRPEAWRKRKTHTGSSGCLLLTVFFCQYILLVLSETQNQQAASMYWL